MAAAENPVAERQNLGQATGSILPLHRTSSSSTLGLNPQNSGSFDRLNCSSAWTEVSMCVLRAFGTNFDVEAFLSASTIKSCAIHRKGEPRLKAKPQGEKREGSGFNAEVSSRGFERLSGQVADALEFLKTHAGELRRLRTFPGVERVTLDFPIEQRVGIGEVVVQGEHLPASLLLAAGSLAFDIDITIYPSPDSAEAAPSSNGPEK